MQSGSRRCQRTRRFGKNCLISRCIFGIARPVDIRRQRHQASFKRIKLTFESDDSLAVGTNFLNRSRHAVDSHR